MRKLLYPLAVLAPISAALAAAPDQITLRNGDRYSGTIVKSDAKALILKTEFAGAVTVDWEAITGIVATQPLTLVLSDGQMIVGTVSSSDERFTVSTKDAGPITTPKTSVSAIRNQEEQKAWELQAEHYRNPGLLDLWTGFFDTGWAKSSGNSRTSSFNLGVNAARSTPRDKVSVYATAIRAANSTAGTKIRTANAERGGARYELNITSSLFGFGFTDLEADEFQKLDLRVAPAGGFGFHVFKKEANFLSVFGGGGYNREFFFDNKNRSSAEVLFGNEIGWQMAKAVTLAEKFVFFPNLTNTGQYRMNFDASAAAKMAKWLSWQATLSDRYLSDPVAGARNNDLLFTTGLRVTFAR